MHLSGPRPYLAGDLGGRLRVSHQPDMDGIQFSDAPPFLALCLRTSALAEVGDEVDGHGDQDRPEQIGQEGVRQVRRVSLLLGSMSATV